MKIKDQQINKLLLDSLDYLKKSGVKPEDIELIYTMARGMYMRGFTDAVEEVSGTLVDLMKSKITKEQALARIMQKFEKE